MLKLRYWTKGVVWRGLWQVEICFNGLMDVGVMRVLRI